ncbi:MAG: hypothetical protein RLZZ598_1531 [Pseudomonadota bacterium]|jgi:hypothetical protein
MKIWARRRARLAAEHHAVDGAVAQQALDAAERAHDMMSLG